MSKKQKNLIQHINKITIPDDTVAIWSLGQMGFAIKGDNDHVIYIDPVLTDVVAERTPEHREKFARAYPPPIQPSEINNASYVLCTHEHMDHADPLTLGPLLDASPKAKLITSKWTQKALEECNIEPQRVITPLQETPLDLGFLRLWSIPAAHYKVEYNNQLGYRYLSFVIEWNNVVIFHSGDTLIYPGYMDNIKNTPRADIALVAMNGRDAYRESIGILGNLYPIEAVWLAQMSGWDVLISGHNDLFEWNAIDPGDLAQAVQKVNPGQKYHTLQPGELFYYQKQKR